MHPLPYVDLDKPAHISFCWFQSEEGRGWISALRAKLREHQLGPSAAASIIGAVQATLLRLETGELGGTRAIRDIKMISPKPMHELRWDALSEHPLHLRLYNATPAELPGVAVGLCFRIKRIMGSPAKTRESQNADIADAIKLLNTAIATNFAECLDRAPSHV